MKSVDNADLDLTIVGGCGHVGLPLALSFADAGLKVGIFDIDEQKMESVKAGRMPFMETGADQLLTKVLPTGRLEFSADPSIIGRTSAVVLVIGTPIDEFLNPSLQVFDKVIDDIAPRLAEGALVVLRSTVYPGVTEWVASALAQRGCKVDVVFCPERIAEGKALEELTGLPQIIGADSDAVAARAEELFSNLGVKTIRTTSKEAELAKLFTNTWRYMKFAVANQFFMIAEDAGVDYASVLHAIRHDYPRAADLPGPGFAAGPCLLKDTMQLASFTGNEFVLGHSAMIINESLPEYIVRSLERDEPLRGKRVAILGMAFKAESDDVRASLSYKLRKVLWFSGAEVICSDPYVKADDLVDAEEAIARSDIVVIAAPHAIYKDLDLSGKKVVDIWALTSPRMSIR